MTKHIVTLADKFGRGVYGVGDTHESAVGKARAEWRSAGFSGRPHESRHRTVAVPAGSRLCVQPKCNGVEWWVETDSPTEQEHST
jgi:hypothetical protein